jgi:hypothetical protein
MRDCAHVGGSAIDGDPQKSFNTFVHVKGRCRNVFEACFVWFAGRFDHLRQVLEMHNDVRMVRAGYRLEFDRLVVLARIYVLSGQALLVLNPLHDAQGSTQAILSSWNAITHSTLLHPGGQGLAPCITHC